MPKATKAEMQQRVKKVYDMLLASESRPEIVQYCTENYDISERQTDTLIARAYEEIATQAEEGKDREFGRSVARLNRLYQIGIQMQDYNFALKALQELNKLMGLYAPNKIDVNQTTNMKVVTHWPEYDFSQDDSVDYGYDE